jgi:hypothetical protein
MKEVSDIYGCICTCSESGHSDDGFADLDLDALEAAKIYDTSETGVFSVTITKGEEYVPPPQGG